MIWMTLFDTNDFYTQYRLSSKLSDLRNDKEFYQKKIEEVKTDREELFSDPELLEKFAREKYLMKRPEEDVFIIVEED
jgi:cell division protein FtsB